MTNQTPAMLVAIITDREQAIASLRAMLKTKDDEIADLKRDCSRTSSVIARGPQA